MAFSPADRVILLAGAASAALFGWMQVGFRRPLGALLPAGTVLPDVAIGDHAFERVAAFFSVLAGNVEAVARFDGMLLGPELYFPLVFAAFLFLLLLRFIDGGRFFNRPVGGPVKAVVLFQPVLYALADYAENAAFYFLSGTATPDGRLLELAPWLTALKFVGASLSVVFILRFALLRRLAPGR